MKSVLISIQPYWVFLIIAKAMGWNIGKQKTDEIRKNYPKANDWNKTAKIYCTKDKKSFARIPKEYQPLMQPFLGKVIGEFVCSNIAKGTSQFGSCLTMREISEYANGKEICGWCISDLVIYDKPKELSEFRTLCKYRNADSSCQYRKVECGCVKFDFNPDCSVNFAECCDFMTRPPQSWCYVEVLENG